MTELLVGLAIGLVLGLVVMYLIFLQRGSGQLGLGLEVARKAAADNEFAEQVHKLLHPPPSKADGTPVRLLAILQREGRLVDFLLEDLAGAADLQIAAAVREIHSKLQAALKEHLEIEPVMPQAEESTVTVPAGFDPSAIRLTGHVSGEPPFQGILKHRGWRVKQILLPRLPEGQDELVLMPAEVDLPPK